MNKKNEVNSGDRLYKIFIYLVLGLLAVLILVPVLWVVIASLKETSEHYGSPWALPTHIHWQNFVDAWNKAKMGDYFLNSIITTGLSLGILLVVALPASYCLARFKFVGQKLLNLCFMAGLFINVNYIVVPIYLMLSDFQTSVGISWLLGNQYVVAVIYAATALPFTIYLLSSYFATLPHDFEEAAYIDGAGYFRTMTQVIFPMAKPSIITVILFNFLSFWNEYIILRTMIGADKSKWTLPAGVLDLMQAQQSKAEYGPMYAGLVLVMVPVLLLYMCVQKNLTKGMTVGGLKG